MIYFWSDTHFNHQGIIKICNRPYKDVPDMNQGLINRWNEVVKPTDDIFHLGDFGFVSHGYNLTDIFNQLNGHKHLIIGNHDEQNKIVLKLAWESMSVLRKVKHQGLKAIVCHFPLASWYHPNKYIHLHGHCHGGLRHKMYNRFDVGVDIFQYPVPFDWLVKKAASNKEQEIHTDNLPDYHYDDL